MAGPDGRQQNGNFSEGTFCGRKLCEGENSRCERSNVVRNGGGFCCSDGWGGGMNSIVSSGKGWCSFAMLCSSLFALNSSLLAQSVDAEVAGYLDKIEKGETEEVKKVLPDLVAKHPNNPAAMYLQGKLS